MAFKRGTASSYKPLDPTAVYRKYSATNNGPKSLWFHQGQLLEDWFENHRSAKDVALELPTGAGKTLVGGLIAEFQRLTDNDRVAYVCPTKQLAKQTSQALSDYGIPNVLLINKVTTWNPAERAKYETAKAVAVTVYHHVFNTNPGIENANLLILDDAHAAAGAVVNPWTVSIDRTSVYADLLSTVREAFSPAVYDKLTRDDVEGYSNDVYLAHPSILHEQSIEIQSVIQQALSTGMLPDGQSYPVEMIAGRWDHCLLYASRNKIEIRPFIAPTRFHSEFDDPARRIYMSATLGEGGELERAFGRPSITRLPTPDGWDSQGTGRRYFVFPELVTDLGSNTAAATKWVSDTIAGQSRTVYLTPDTRTADALIAGDTIPASHTVMKAKDVEKDLSAFTNNDDRVLLLTNRYDGLDLPDDQCRLVIMDGLPARGDLQERFMTNSLGCLDVLNERVRSRIVQGAGRATRNERDYAVVVILGDDLNSHLNRSDVQLAMHPDVQAEIDFGLEQSFDTSVADIDDNIRIFLEHGTDWADIDTDIQDASESKHRKSPVGTQELQSAARFEVQAWEHIWAGDYEAALVDARQAVTELRGSRAPQRYAALWNFFASWLADRVQHETGKASYNQASADFYKAARKAARGTTWLTETATPPQTNPSASAADTDPLDDAAVTAVIDYIGSLGRDSVFDQTVVSIATGLGETAAKPYEAALVRMGKFLGATEAYGDGNATAAPDAVWIFDDLEWTTWEAKSESKPGGFVSAENSKQASGHLRFITDKRQSQPPSGSHGFLATPHTEIHSSAKALAEDHVFGVQPAQILDLFNRTVRAWRKLRTMGSTPTHDDVAALFAEHRCLPSQWLTDLTTQPLKSYPLHIKKSAPEKGPLPSDNDSDETDKRAKAPEGDDVNPEST